MRLVGATPLALFEIIAKRRRFFGGNVLDLTTSNLVTLTLDGFTLEQVCEDPGMKFQDSGMPPENADKA